MAGILINLKCHSSNDVKSIFFLFYKHGHGGQNEFKKTDKSRHRHSFKLESEKKKIEKIATNRCYE